MGTHTYIINGTHKVYKELPALPISKYGIEPFENDDKYFLTEKAWILRQLKTLEIITEFLNFYPDDKIWIQSFPDAHAITENVPEDWIEIEVIE